MKKPILVHLILFCLFFYFKTVQAGCINSVLAQTVPSVNDFILEKDFLRNRDTACGDQRRLTGNGSALEVVLHDYALYKSTFILLTLLPNIRVKSWFKGVLTMDT